MGNPLADIDNICFFDTETRAEDHVSASDGNVKTAGTYRYAKSSFVIVSTWAIGSGPLFEVSLDRGFDGDWLCWDEMPSELREFHKRVEQREAWYAAFNAGFDRNAWNNGTYDFPLLEPDMIIDVMAQAIASNLPASLEGASRAITGKGKQDDGKALINLFCSRGGATPQAEPEAWERFKSYGLRDTDEMREVWRHTRPLPLDEWEDYWVSERINERGVAIDVALAERASAVAAAEAARLNKELTRWTNGQITKVTQTKRIGEWVYDRLRYSEAREILVKEWNENASTEDGDDADVTVGKLSLEKGRIEALLAFYAAREEEHGGLDGVDRLIVDVVQARQFGGSSSPFKFDKMIDQHDGGRLKGQYVFNGAQQTGRFSSKGVQTHNLKRDSLGAGVEEEAIEFIMERLT
ncbi:MAG: hypothetical protein WCY29_05895 [Novosphingobium sp.]